VLKLESETTGSWGKTETRPADMNTREQDSRRAGGDHEVKNALWARGIHGNINK
jgi:hypothetical protein